MSVERYDAQQDLLIAQGHLASLDGSLSHQWFMGRVLAMRVELARKAHRRVVSHGEHEYIVGQVKALDAVIDFVEKESVRIQQKLKAQGL